MSESHAGTGERRETATSGGNDTLTYRTAWFRVSVVHFPKGRLALHYHERGCLSVVLDGGFTEVFARHHLDCGVQSALIKPPGEQHRDVLFGSRQLIIEPDMASTVWPGRIAEAFDNIAVTPAAHAMPLVTRLVRALTERDHFTDLEIDGLCLEVISAVARANSRAPRETHIPKWLTRIHEMLIARIAPISPEELARVAGVHPMHVMRSFRKHYHMSIAQFMRLQRLDWAATQLETSDESLATLAARAGFADQSHFTRAFREHTGTTPMRYRAAAVRKIRG